jgi:hypothetical protein
LKLITELVEEVQVIAEDSKTGGAKNLYIQGVFMQAGIPNKNRRIYPESILENEVARYVAEDVSKKKAYGELNHPPTPSVDLERACIRICELKKDGGNYIGKALVLNTPMGGIVRGLIEGDCNLGVSSRGMGSLKKTGVIDEVQSDFRLATAADVVSNPSAPDAFVNGIMENVEWVHDEKNGWKALDIVEATRKAMHVKKLDESQMLQAFNQFLARVKDVSIDKLV